MNFTVLNNKSTPGLPAAHRGQGNITATLLVVVQLLMVVLWLPVSRAEAAEVQGLYQTEVLVSSRDDERERTRAFRSGLQDVLLKLSGRADTLNLPQVRQALLSAQRFVAGWAYQSQQAGTAEEATRFLLQISYFQPEIQRLLDEAGVSLWPANRPDTLIWLVIQDELGTRHLATAASEDAPLFTVMSDTAKRRALPTRLPLLDLEDLLKVTPDQVWVADREALQAASLRYGSDSILAIRLFRTLTGETFAKASYLYHEQLLELESFEQSETEFLTAAVNMAAEELAATFAVRLSGVDNTTRVNLTVQGVRTISDYATLLSYLNGLAVVSEVQVLEVNGSELMLQLKTGGQLRQLLETLALETKLQQLSEPTRAGQEFAIRFNWQRP